MRDGDYFIAQPNIKRPNGYFQDVGAVGNPNGRMCANVIGKLSLSLVLPLFRLIYTDCCAVLLALQPQFHLSSYETGLRDLRKESSHHLYFWHMDYPFSASGYVFFFFGHNFFSMIPG